MRDFYCLGSKTAPSNAPAMIATFWFERVIGRNITKNPRH
jgi:tryptophan synthase beta subunit